MRTEISAKFRRGDGRRASSPRPASGSRSWWTDDPGDFALSLATPF